MPRYVGHQISFEPPPEWVDRTIVVFEAPRSGDVQGTPIRQAWKLEMISRPMREGERLRTHADRLLVEAGRELSHFDLQESREVELDGQPAIYIRYECMSVVEVLEQSITLVEAPGSAGRSVAMFKTTAPLAEADAARPVFAQILASIRLGAASPPQGVPGRQPARTPSALTIEPTAPEIPIPGSRAGNPRR
jgi:hypothetical protein